MIDFNFWWAIASPIIALLIPLTMGALLIWAERRLLAIWQDRLGPNRVGPLGLLQVVADAIKMFFKEDWIPPFADKKVFILAPAIIIGSILASFSLIPWTRDLVVFDSEVGILVFLALSSLGTYSIALAGWASNNKYALLGSIRSIGQMIAYEVFMGISLMGVVIKTGSFRFIDIIEAQSTGWNILGQFIGFIVFYIAALAETHRLPFDLPEAESELIAGFHSEYSGLKFGMFFVGEYMGITLMSAMMTILFFGGWQGPILPPFIWFMLKTCALIASFILLRAALPRPRIDQLISFGWKFLLPLSLVNLLFTALVALM
ncbi:MAG: NADH-quinone oxidoreductase subunit NuoH [Myxococcales bacterium]|nr:MAG: NADH-quinone oxidoreductase subunit NuoH [Myxococcales bacterium]